LLEALTVGPAKIVGIEAPRVQEGARADVALIDPEARWRVERATLHGKSVNTPFFGKELVGAIDATVVHGRIVFRREISGDPR